MKIWVSEITKCYFLCFKNEPFLYLPLLEMITITQAGLVLYCSEHHPPYIYIKRVLLSEPQI